MKSIFVKYIPVLLNLFVENFDSSSESNPSTSCSSANGNKESQTPVSVTLSDLGLPSQVFIAIWSKASEILSKQHSIVDSPGANNIKICISYTSSRPHIVQIFKSGKVICDCKNNESLAMCAHI